MIVAGIVLSATAILLSLPVAVLTIEIMTALVARIDNERADTNRPAGHRVAVLIPAHNEEDGIGQTVLEIKMQLLPSDRLIIVADNCSDTTEEEARAAGAETIVRRDIDRRGKGYALDFGLRYLDGDPPQVVVIVDADCRIGPGTIDALVAGIVRTNLPAQAFNVMRLASNTDAKRRVAGFAWIIKNHVRPAGLAALGLPCQLMGTGMAIPWDAIRRINVATGNIVEDVKMGLDLAAVGFAPIYCPEARVESDLPMTERGFAVQRQRWEAGSLRTALVIAPVMFLRGLARLNAPLMSMALDSMVPPLMMLLATLMMGLILSSVLVIAGGSIVSAKIFGLSLGTLLLSLALAWLQFGRSVLPPRDILALPGVFVRKIGLYIAMWRERSAGWIRTDRN